MLAGFVLASCTSLRKTQIHYPAARPHGLDAELFAPGLISTNANEHSVLAFSPDGSVVLWAIMDKNFRGRLLEMKYVNGKWSKPASPSFADTTADDYCPSFSVDGQKLFFSSRRKAPEGYPTGRGNRIWTVDKQPDGWGMPTPLDTTVSKAKEFGHSIAKNGTIYFASGLDGGADMNILKAEKTVTGYTKPVLLPYSINSVGYEDGPCISQNEDYLIFESTRPDGIAGSHDLYISFKDKNKRWGMPVNMGPKINSAGWERFPRLSPDGKYLFFASDRDKSAGKTGYDIYWIDAKLIEELRNQKNDYGSIEQPLGDEIIVALDQRNTSSSANLLKQWLGFHPGSLDATVVYSAHLRKLRLYSEAEQLLGGNESGWNGNINIMQEMALVKWGLHKDQEAQKSLDILLSAGEDQRSGSYMYLSNELFGMEIFNLSDEYLDKAMSVRPNGFNYFNRARAYILNGMKEKAFIALNKAVDLGFNRKTSYENNPNLQPHKSDLKWAALMDRLK